VSRPVELTFVIPVYNGARSIGRVVRRIHELYGDLAIEVVLVNDGSQDDSEAVCRGLVHEHPGTVVFLQLARNFGEHNAVLAGLGRSRGAFVVVLDDDAQNPPEEVRRLYDEARRGGFDVVYGRYRVKHHSAFRNFGSWFNDRMANVMLGKPPELYLSSFKLMNRFVVEEIVKYRGAFPYIDGLILRTTRSIGQIDVEHRREETPSGYNMRRLFLLWLNMMLNFSIAPLRLSALVGLTMSGLSVLLMLAIVLDKLYVDPELPLGIPTVLVLSAFFAGLQLLILGTIGEYLGRLFLDHSQSPQYVVRYVEGGSGDGAPAPARSDGPR
jgi:undecaprenyl-phosphate 4-deoxy-4-formamido-L-arabinose transferase